MRVLIEVVASEAKLFSTVAAELRVSTGIGTLEVALYAAAIVGLRVSIGIYPLDYSVNALSIDSVITKVSASIAHSLIVSKYCLRGIISLVLLLLRKRIESTVASII